MPIYEYQSVDPKKSCAKCIDRFEIIQGIAEKQISKCPSCGQTVKKVISWCRAAIVETSESYGRVEQQINEYEKQGMWSHAAELADKHSEKTNDHTMKTRALDDYEKAGYSVDTLNKHANSDTS
jgi:putative FmdB family regulatory protein